MVGEKPDEAVTLTNHCLPPLLILLCCNSETKGREYGYYGLQAKENTAAVYTFKHRPSTGNHILYKLFSSVTTSFLINQQSLIVS